MIISLLTGALLLLGWAYAGYPLFTWMGGARLLAAPRDSDRPLGRSWLLVSAYNEVAVIAGKLENSLQLEDEGELRVVVVSDGSMDGTDELVERIAERDPRVSLIRVEGRKGKNHALNVALAQLAPADEDVVVFSDANSLYRRDALRHLRQCLASGAFCAVGRLAFMDATTGTARAEGLYWRYENLLKAAEGMAGRLLVANGAIFALRAGDVPRLPLGIGNDFWIPVTLLGAGRSIRYEPRAVALEMAPQHGSEEFQRKLRMANRSMGGVMQAWPLVDASTRFQLVSHKVLRWLGLPLYLCALLLAAAAAVVEPGFVVAPALLALPALVAAIGGLGRAVGVRIPGVDFAVHFFLVHLAACMGVAEALTGKKRITWEQAASARRAAA